ncbi:hypothetical protein FBU30_001604 [Linnemannia zychae]|nr:hypothetical protein FBU30_001604 [Linnemannia zychae]
MFIYKLLSIAFVATAVLADSTAVEICFLIKEKQAVIKSTVAYPSTLVIDPIKMIDSSTATMCKDPDTFKSGQCCEIIPPQLESLDGKGIAQLTAIAGQLKLCDTNTDCNVPVKRGLYTF